MRRILMLAALAVLLGGGPRARGEDLEQLKKDLRHFDYKERLRAIEGLEALASEDPSQSEKAAGALESVIGDEDWEVQIRALEALGRMKANSVQAGVARAIVQGEILKVRRAAARALNAMEIPNAYPQLLKAAQRTRNEDQKIHALEAAHILAKPEDWKEIVPFTGNREREIRIRAYGALGATGSPDALSATLRGLRDKEVEVRAAAAVALGDIGGKEAMEGLAKLALSESDPYLIERIVRSFRKYVQVDAAAFLAESANAEKPAARRTRLVRVLSELRSEATGPALRELLSDAEPQVRAWAARGIGYAGYADGTDALDPLVIDDPDPTVRRMALEALMKLLPEGGRRTELLGRCFEKGAEEIRIRACVLAKEKRDLSVLPLLYPLVDAEGWRVPTAAIITIGTLGHQPEVEVLARRVEDRDWRIRAAIVEGLGQLRHMDAVPYLVARLSDRDPVVKSAALKNLQVLSQLHKGPDVGFWEKWYEENKDTLDLTKKGYREEVADDYYAKTKYLIEILNKAQIVCVLGKWDHAELVLEHLGIRQTVVRPQELLSIGLNPKQLVLINCEGSIGKKEAEEHLRWFVHVGGYLMTTDWALQNALVRAFPGYIDRDSKAKTGNDVVHIEPAQPDHPLIRGVFDEETRLMWWLEVIAYPMKVVDLFRTEILVDSVEMLTKKYGSSTMAAAFDYGHGKVEHCISHFFLQEEGFTEQATKEARKIFAADNLGIPLEQIRQLDAKGFFDGSVTEAQTKQIAESYSMFKLIVNFVVEKRRQVEQQ